MQVKHHPTRDLTRQWHRDDGAKLARLYNESGPGWPGGFGARDTTPQEAAREIREHDHLAAFVAEADDRIVSYCTMNATPGERYSYIGFLNAHPAYHGRGFGKAVLLSAVERAIALGFERIILGTWPGNLKAVPLYKKSGFMWTPETEVMMESFVPAALRLSWARPFFDKHNWYETQVRDLALHDDAYRHGKVRAFQYLWRADDDLLRLVFDYRSKGLLEIETNDLRVGCYLPDEKLVADMPHEIRWEIESKDGRERNVVLVSEPEPGITCAFRRSFVVRGRETHAAQFTIDPDIAEKEREPFAHIIRSTMLLDGQPLELAAGMEVRQAATVGSDPDFLSVCPGTSQRVLLQVTSNLEQPARARIATFCSHGARMKRQTASLDLAPRARARFPVILTPDRAGQVDLRAAISLKVGRRTVRAKHAHIALRALEPGAVVGSVDEHRAVLESESLRIIIGRDGHLRIFDRLRDAERTAPHAVMSLFATTLGPPFAWQDFFVNQRLDAAIEQQQGAATAVLRSDSVQRPGLLLERRVTLTHRPVVEIRDTIVNTTGAARDLSILRRGWPEVQAACWEVPGPAGVVESPTGAAALGLSDLHLSEEAADWPEGWTCVRDERGFAAGLIWQGATRVERDGWGIHQPLGRAEPGGRVEAPPLYIFAGPGGAQAIRSWWRALCADKTEPPGTEPPVASSPPVEFGLEPKVPVVPTEGAETRVFVKSVGRRKLSGRLRLRMPGAIRAERTVVPFENVAGDNPMTAPMRVTPGPSARPGMRCGQAELRLEQATYSRDLPLIIVPAPRDIEEHREGRLLSLRADPMTLRVDPSFCGCAVSLTWEGRELLHSAYPEQRPFMYWNPWFGGICPSSHDLHGLLHDEKFTGRFVLRTGRSGIPWRGIAVSCSPKHERAAHLRLSLEYLLLPGVPLFALGVTCGNRLNASAHAVAGADIWFVLGGKPKDPIVAYRADEPQVVRRRTQNHAGMNLDPWGVVHNPRAKCAVLLARGRSHGTYAGAGLARDGYNLALGSFGLLQPGQPSRAYFYLAFGRSARQVEAYRHLAGCEDLP